MIGVGGANATNPGENAAQLARVVAGTVSNLEHIRSCMWGVMAILADVSPPPCLQYQYVTGEPTAMCCTCILYAVVSLLLTINCPAGVGRGNIPDECTSFKPSGFCTHETESGSVTLLLTPPRWHVSASFELTQYKYRAAPQAR